MQVLRTVSQIKEIDRNEKTIGFVPTMGALHNGHISLVKRCRTECDIVIVSIFVNPTQFNDPKDLERYPRTEQADLVLLQEAGVDFVFAPSVAEVYPTPDTRTFDFGALERVMEGASRPGHFNGVAQVVSRLFEIVEPTKSYFGKKDYQQLAIIREMVKQLQLTVEIVGCEIIRDADGLAMSSRNALLSAEQRAAAPHIHRVLSEIASKSGNAAEMEKQAAAKIGENPYLKTEYITVARSNNLQKSESSENCHIFAAVKCGEIRLIDNIECK